MTKITRHTPESWATMIEKSLHLSNPLTEEQRKVIAAQFPAIKDKQTAWTQGIYKIVNGSELYAPCETEQQKLKEMQVKQKAANLAYQEAKAKSPTPDKHIRNFDPIVTPSYLKMKKANGLVTQAQKSLKLCAYRHKPSPVHLLLTDGDPKKARHLIGEPFQICGIAGCGPVLPGIGLRTVPTRAIPRRLATTQLRPASREIYDTVVVPPPQSIFPEKVFGIPPKWLIFALFITAFLAVMSEL